MGAGTHFSLRGPTLPRLAIVFVFCVVLFLSRGLWWPYAPTDADWLRPKLHDEPPAAHEASQEELEQVPVDSTLNDAAQQSCKDVPGADNVMVMLKTGATELYQKLPTHLMTTFQCIPNFMIFSDLEQHFADQPVHDALASVSASTREQRDDFKLYKEIAKWQREGQVLSKLKGDGGWNLDKWKFLPMFHETFNRASDNIKWFIMIEADTSLSWTNLLQWLRTMDPTKEYYLGAQNVIGDQVFGHGGSGVVLSRAAADALKRARDDNGHQTYDSAWEEVTGNSCCGDEIIARALGRVGINLTAAWPLIQGETISSIDWTAHHWCAPPVTWHHVSPIEVDSLWQFEHEWVRAHGWDTPYLYRDVFARYVQPHIAVNRTDWTNLSKDRKFAIPDVAADDDNKWDELQDWERAAVESPDACAAACQRAGQGECIQWMHTRGRCHLGRDIRFGHSDEHEDQHFVSGWMQDRIRTFRGEQKGCNVRWTG